MQPNETRTDRNWDSGRLIPAIVLIGLGSLFLLGNLHLIPSMNWFDFWPVILIVIGAVKLAEGNRRGNYTGGAILLGIGAAFLASNLGVLPFPVWDLWPLLLIWIGIVLLFQRISLPDLVRQNRWSSNDWRSANVSAGDLNLTAVFSGGKRKIVSDDFRGGTISAVFGGFELDLRSAVMKTNAAVIKIDAVFGGVEMRIPEDWCAVVEGVGIFGGYSDETLHPPMTPETKRLILKGGAVFGGVVVKN
jgi:predicted membrane protein